MIWLFSSGQNWRFSPGPEWLIPPGANNILYGNGEKPGHEDDFKKAFGVTAEQVSSYLYHVISEGKVVSNEPKLRNGRYGYERVYKYQGRYTVLMAIGINGFVVTAYPYSE